ncbi:Zinc finger protein constans-like [Thalictrum thalictroides]|uniref:Zinc finger protein constans-like n=1 Tax=Thalictrum thalictroides TaxID=46969 RepID=A0A7J6W920_THATH|nr:Zinc finger protein constans-like [Thalictrum thalictroides]
MGHLCDFCGQQRATVYCRSDAASLCLSCDQNVHSANALSRRHSRTLLCQKCNSQPASFRCIHHNISFCQNCDWNEHCTSTSPTPHDRQPINCYSGCPSAEQLSKIFSLLPDVPSANEYACEQKLGLMSIDEDTVTNYMVPSETNNIVDPSVTRKMSNDGNEGQFGAWTGSSSMPGMNPLQCTQLAGSVDSTTPKPSPRGLEGLGTIEDDFCKDFNVDDIDLNFENYEELFGICQNQREQDIGNGGIDNLFGMPDMSAIGSGCQGGFLTKGSLAGKDSLMQSLCQDTISADSVMSVKTEPNFCYSAVPAHSSLSLSFSGLTGESATGDYQDSGVSSMLLMDEPPWFPPGTDNSFLSANRDSAVMRYKEKKKARKFEKKIRYESRKARADVRKRVKGRFVKSGEAYDYDPLSQTRSC